MSSSLEQQIARLVQQARTVVYRLYYSAIANIRRVQRTRVYNRNQVIQSIIQQYNASVEAIQRKLDADIQALRAAALPPAPAPTQETMDVLPENIQRKLGLLVGVNYVGTPYALSGCIDDAKRMEAFLSQRGYQTFQIMTDETSLKPTKTNILNELESMLKASTAGDLLFFYFSGHGSYTVDRNGDEKDGQDEMIISVDGNGVLDDEIKTLLSNHLKKDVTLVGLFDSCHSGSMFDLRHIYLDSENDNQYTEHTQASECAGNVLTISGCMDKQTSAEATIDGKPQGAVSWAFYSAMNQSNGNLTWRELVVQMRDILNSHQFTQTPQLSADTKMDIDRQIFI